MRFSSPIANVEGNYFAMAAICKHEQWDLSEGSLNGMKVICPHNGAAWNLKSGKAAFEEPLKTSRFTKPRLRKASFT